MRSSPNLYSHDHGYRSHMTDIASLSYVIRSKNKLAGAKRKQRWNWPSVTLKACWQVLSITAADPGFLTPVVNSADHHVSRVQSQRSASVCYRRSRIAQDLNFLIRTDDPLRFRQV